MATNLLHSQLPTERVLRLDTAVGDQIENAQTPESISVGCAEAMSKKYAREFPKCEKRTSTPTGMYNCHGLTFASRRTKIFSATEVRKIIKHDQYTPVTREAVMPGDIVLYVDDSGDISHSGVVVNSTDPKNTLDYPVVVSKWGDWLEVIHRANHCPYVGPDVEIKYLRCVLTGAANARF